MASDLRLLGRALKNHSGPPFAFLFSVLILIAAIQSGAPLWLFGPLALIWWVPVFWTAWNRRHRYMREHESMGRVEEETYQTDWSDSRFYDLEPPEDGLSTASELRTAKQNALRLADPDERVEEMSATLGRAIKALEFRERIAVDTGQYVHRLEQERSDLWTQRNELEDENEHLRRELERREEQVGRLLEPDVEKLVFEEGVLEAWFGHAPAIKVLAASLRKTLDEHEATNYLEVELTPEGGDTFKVTVHRPGRKTPHEKLEELRESYAELVETHMLEGYPCPECGAKEGPPRDTSHKLDCPLHGYISDLEDGDASA